MCAEPQRLTSYTRCVTRSLGTIAVGFSRRRGSAKLVLAALIPYLLMPFYLVSDFIPVADYLDDAVIAAFALRYILRGSGPVGAHWPGPPADPAAALVIAAVAAREGSES